MIDILLVNKNENLLIVELKLGQDLGLVCDQIMRYMRWVKRHVTQKRDVRGLIIAEPDPTMFCFARADVPGSAPRAYNLHIAWRDTPRHGSTKD